MPSYTKEQKVKALHLLDDLKSPQKVMDIWGYPEKRDSLYNWMKRRNEFIPQESETGNISVYQVRIRNISQDAILSCLLNRMSVKSIAETLNYSPETIYKWRKIFLDQGYKNNQCLKKRPRHRSDSAEQQREGSDNRCPEE